MKLAGLNLCESMKLVQNHLENCPCCQDEFEALLAALSESGDY
jgi:predicted anti-sigma-YlaC factor YlaD